MQISTYDGEIYAVPSYIDASVVFYNKDLFEKAGLDPENPPKTWDDVLSAARKISGLGDDTYGYYISGNCAGCNAFTFLPYIWASGGQVLSDNGQQASFDSPTVLRALEFYRALVAEDLADPSGKSDTGTNFGTAFLNGKIGMSPGGTGQLAAYVTEPPDFDWGVFPIPGETGGQSSFIGGDVIGITSGADDEDSAWKFLKWTLDEQQQLNIYAKNGEMTVRQDLIDNKYVHGDPRRKLMNSTITFGYTPKTLPYNEIFNSPTGPLLNMLRTAIYQGNTRGAANKAQQEVSSILDKQ